MSSLYIVGTPIGNLGDLSYRAVEILKNADLVACEDTRRTLKLLTSLGIRVPLISCRSQNEEAAALKILGALDSGKKVAYCSDAGTPGLSDPGETMVRMASSAGHTVIPVPGPSAFAALVSVSGGRGTQIFFEGFLSPRPGRRRSRLQELLETGYAFVLYESPFRILKLMEDLATLDSSRYVCIGREMTKIHEEYIRGSAAEVRELVSASQPRGEYAVFVAGFSHNEPSKL
ncbi:ribosomal RNA small subunit methyltransferase I [Spirochaetia bacterium]|nr:ribosomal RNA small subunit methyltransferase I [Spirochaetia bacterium]GHU38117.1 ribosomal RNA small subunit methyltransferase I [Spirochaetia bacterium]